MRSRRAIFIYRTIARAVKDGVLAAGGTPMGV